MQNEQRETVKRYFGHYGFCCRIYHLRHMVGLAIFYLPGMAVLVVFRIAGAGFWDVIISDVQSTRV